MRGDRKLRRLAAIGLVCLGLHAGPTLAREPEGAVRLEVDRIASQATSTTTRALRIRIEPFVEIRDGRLSYELPGGIELEPLDGDLARAVEPRAAGTDGSRRAEIVLGTVRTARVLEFGLTGAPALKQASLRLTLIGRRVGGAEFRTTLNVPLIPDEQSPGRLLHGAWQFEARRLDGQRP